MIGDGLRMLSLLARRMGRGSGEAPHLGGRSEVQGRDQENVGTSGLGWCGLRGDPRCGSREIFGVVRGGFRMGPGCLVSMPNSQWYHSEKIGRAHV